MEWCLRNRLIMGLGFLTKGRAGSSGACRERSGAKVMLDSPFGTWFGVHYLLPENPKWKFRLRATLHAVL
jgi:hypothetical protein